jgi:hypothetical protein
MRHNHRLTPGRVFFNGTIFLLLGGIGVFSARQLSSPIGRFLRNK